MLWRAVRTLLHRARSGDVYKRQRLGDLQIMAKVTFRFEEGEPVVTYATEGERLLEVAQKSNVPILSLIHIYHRQIRPLHTGLMN